MAHVLGFSQTVAFAHHDGLTLWMDVYSPQGNGPFGALLFAHGGRWTGGDRHSGVEPIVELCAAARLVCFSMDYRLAPQFPFPAAVDDVEDAVSYVRAHAAEYNVDPRRIVLSGESAGGHLVSFAAARDNARLQVRGVVAFSAPQDLLALCKWLRGVGVVPPEIRAFLNVKDWNAVTERKMKSASPVFQVNTAASPYLLVHAVDDPLVDSAQPAAMCRAVKLAGGQCEVLLVAENEHRVAAWTHSDAWKSSAVEWLRHLQ